MEMQIQTDSIGNMVDAVGGVFLTGGGVALTSMQLSEFVALVKTAERERCAKVCESLVDLDDDSCNEAERCAAAIRGA